MAFIIKYADADGSALSFEDDADNPKRAKLRAKGGIEKGGAARAEVYDEDSGKMVLVCKDKGGKAVCSKPGSSKSASEPAPRSSSSSGKNDWAVPVAIGVGALALLFLSSGPSKE